MFIYRNKKMTLDFSTRIQTLNMKKKSSSYILLHTNKKEMKDLCQTPTQGTIDYLESNKGGLARGKISTIRIMNSPSNWNLQVSPDHSTHVGSNTCLMLDTAHSFLTLVLPSRRRASKKLTCLERDSECP
jgi:hypothetical protein